MNNNLLELVCERVGPAGGTIRRAFHRMAIAEDVLEDLFGDKSNEPEGAFRACQSPAWSYEAGDLLYELHIREILERMRDGEDTDFPTTAEMIYTVSRWSLQAPLTNDMAAAFETLWMDAGLPPVASLGEGTVEISNYEYARTFYESYDGAALELIETTIRRAAAKLPRFDEETEAA